MNQKEQIVKSEIKTICDIMRRDIGCIDMDKKSCESF